VDKAELLIYLMLLFFYFHHVSHLQFSACRLRLPPN
jgi:hypothetical protein